MKRLALALTLISSAALLSGCIIVPHRHGHHHGGYGHYQGGDYRSGPAYGQPGPRR
jgi:uncharacterized protein YceK